MKLDGTVIDRFRVNFRPRAYLRVTPQRFSATPLGLGFGETRFASPSKSFKVLYVASDLATGIAETVVRDRFVARVRRKISEDEIDIWGVTEIQPNAPLSVLDLRATALVHLGASTDISRAKSHRHSRIFSEYIYANAPLVDGILYNSRLTNKPCVAVYDRAVVKLSAGGVRPLIRQAALVPALRDLHVTIVRP